MKRIDTTRDARLQAVALPALAALMMTVPADAQAQTTNSQQLPAVVVEQPSKPKVRRAAPATHRRVARTSARTRSRGNAPATLEPSPSSGASEQARGPVQGYIANLSATGTKTDTPLRDIPQSISVVTADFVRDQGSRTVQEALQYVPGVFADAYGVDSRGDYPRFRGQDPNIYLDGTRVVNTYVFNEWRQDPYTLERMEVLRGPASVLYGDTSTAGLLNLISKMPQEKSANEIGVQYGSFNRKQVQMDSTGKLTRDGEWLYRFVGVFRDSGMQTDFVPDDRLVLAPSITWRPTKNTSWTVLGTYQKDKTGSSTAFLPIEGTLYAGPNGFIPVNRFASEPGYDRYRTETGAVSSLFEHSFNNALKVRQNLRYTHVEGGYHSMYPDVYSNPVDPFLDPARRAVARFSFDRETIKDSLTVDNNAELKLATGPLEHKMLFGLDYRVLWENARSGGGYDTRPFDLYAPVYTGFSDSPMTAEPRSRQSQVGLYAQDQIRLGHWLAVAGVRQDFVTNDIEGSALQQDRATTGRLGLMYELPFGITPYVSYAQSFNPIFGGGICASFCVPQRGEQVELGIKYNPFAGTTVNVAVYDTTENNRLAADPTNPLLSIQIGEVRIRGAELEVLSHVTANLDLVAGYAYTDAKIASGDNAGKHVETVPLNQASLWAKYRLAALGLPNLSIGAGARYTGTTWDGVDNFHTPSYTLFDAMIRYDTGPWTFQVNAKNLADKRHVTTCLARGDCFYGLGRTVLGSVTYRF
jgi:iron complex outermembrane receptor protein